MRKSELKLSDSYREKCDTIPLEVVVKVININYEKGEALKRVQQTKEETAKKMLAKASALAGIVELTGLGEEEITEIE